MTRVAWTTDTHFDHSNQDARDRFLKEVIGSDAEALIITGDISGGKNSLLRWLNWLDEALDIPLWIVLGNHDYYNGSIDEVRKIVNDWLIDFKPDWRHWFRADGEQELYPTSKTAVVGTDGWYDARFGKVDGSVILNDFFYVHDLRPFAGAGKMSPSSILLPKLRELADEETRILEIQVDNALEARDRILVVTHVPPFADAAWHEGSRSEVTFLPFFSCRSMGEMLVKKMEQHPEKEMLVLCGHTHSSGVFRPLPNLKVETGGAVYGSPALCGVVEV